MPTMKFRRSIVWILILFGSAFAARADINLATFSYTGRGQTSAFPTWQPYLSYGDPNDVSPLGFMDNITMSVVDIINGTHFDLTGDLANFSSMGANNINDVFYIGFVVPGGTGSAAVTTELDLLSGATFILPGLGAPDFAGYNITRISVIGTSFQALAEGAFDTTIEFTVIGVVPEPSTFALCAVGLAAVVVRARRKRE